MPFSKTKAVQYQKTLRQKRRAAGVCVRCGKERTDVRITCAACAARENGYVQNVVAVHLAAGRCRCGKEIEPSYRVCRRCLDESIFRLRELKQQVFAGYGGKCQCCGCSVFEFLSVDHVDERGCDERRRLGRKMNSGSFYRMIIRENFPTRYQIACFNCNMALGLSGYCPHHPEIRRSTKKG